MTIAWVVGGSGLLGAALGRALRARGTALFEPPRRFTWDQPLVLAEQIRAAVCAFALDAQAVGRWEVHWAAGVGTMGSTEEHLAPETIALSTLLAAMAREPRLTAVPGAVSLASSAGAIYAGSRDEVITEASAVSATTAYATAKLRQEALVRDFAAAHRGISTLIARLSTIYGPGQAAGKSQGLLAQMVRQVIRHQPIQIYVPFDTIRDYLDADDAAVAMTGVLRTLPRGAEPLTKIVAAQTPTTIAEVLAIVRRLARRAPLVVRSAHPLSALYARRVQFRSVVGLDYVRPPCKPLAVGMSQLMRAEQLLFVRGAAATPAWRPPR